MTLNDLEWLFHDKMRFWPALLESERLNVRNSTTSAIVRCSVHFTIYNTYTYTATTEKQRVSCAYMRSWRAVSLR